MKLGAIILAAGFSSRMGEFKPLLNLDGQSMLEHCVNLFEAAGLNSTVVVTGHRTHDVRKRLHSRNVRVLHNPYFWAGMFSSIQAGLEKLGPCDGFFVLPVDIPLIRPVTISTLCNAFSGHKTLFPSFAGKQGYPPLIPATLKKKILHANREKSLEDILMARAHKEIEVWDAAILTNADTPDDYAAMRTTATRRDILTFQEAEIFAQLHMPKRILPHGKKVAEMALALAHHIDSGKNFDRELIYGAALLHDIAKGRADHEQRGAKILHNCGLDRMAKIVAAHRDLLPPASGRLTEKELVYLADKLICGTQQVKIKKRFHEKLRRHHNNKETCRAIRKRLRHAIAIAELWEKKSGKQIDNWINEKR